MYGWKRARVEMKVRPKRMRNRGHQRSMKEGLLCALMLRFSVSVQMLNEIGGGR
jgi:hypothetical protein